MLLSKKLLFYQNQFPKEYFVPGEYTTYLMPGRYFVVTRAGGGAGGASGVEGGAGGAGGKGNVFAKIFDINDIGTAKVIVGDKGLVFSEGGNGGDHGSGGTKPAGSGGGGGHGSYVGTKNLYCLANGGGGGGGGGGGHTNYARYGGGSPGAGGGGYYKMNEDGTETNYNGQTGGKTGGSDTARGGNGVNGTTSLFPNCYSVAGVAGYKGAAGGASARGGGASGGGGGDNGNHDDSAAYGGSGGAGAGGDYDAGGGAEGAGGGGDAYNHHTIPTDTTEENALYGVVGNYGTGGTTAKNGTGGFVLIHLGEPVTKYLDFGIIFVTETDDIDDAGLISSEVEDTDDAGMITEEVTESDNAENILIPVEATEFLDLGSVDEPTDNVINLGNII